MQCESLERFLRPRGHNSPKDAGLSMKVVGQAIDPNYEVLTVKLDTRVERCIRDRQGIRAFIAESGADSGLIVRIWKQ